MLLGRETITKTIFFKHPQVSTYKASLPMGVNPVAWLTSVGLFLISFIYLFIYSTRRYRCTGGHARQPIEGTSKQHLLRSHARRQTRSNWTLGVCNLTSTDELRCNVCDCRQLQDNARVNVQ